MQKPIYPFYVIWANDVLKVEIINDLEQIKNLKVKTIEDVAGFYHNGFYHHLEKTGNYRRSQKYGKSQIGVYRFLHLHPSHVHKQTHRNKTQYNNNPPPPLNRHRHTLTYQNLHGKRQLKRCLYLRRIPRNSRLLSTHYISVLFPIGRLLQLIYPLLLQFVHIRRMLHCCG